MWRGPVVLCERECKSMVWLASCYEPIMPPAVGLRSPSTRKSVVLGLFLKGHIGILFPGLLQSCAIQESFNHGVENITAL